MAHEGEFSLQESSQSFKNVKDEDTEEVDKEDNDEDNDRTFVEDINGNGGGGNNTDSGGGYAE